MQKRRGRPPKVGAQKVQWCLQLGVEVVEEYDAFFKLLHTGAYRYDFRNTLVEQLLSLALTSFKKGQRMVPLEGVHRLMEAEIYSFQPQPSGEHDE